MAAILNFRICAKNGKTQICFYLLNCVTQSDFVEIFDPQGIRAMYSWQFQKMFPSPKIAAILNFRIFPKNTRHKIASISLTVRDRAISSKFSTHRVSKKCTLGNFHKIFPSPHMAAILNFWSAPTGIAIVHWIGY